ncbi:ABC transporter ATP-binding protein [Rhizobium leguminosarum]|uniref:Sugar ABC transporter ATP-binding protein n=2 Tax=Rhizobium leguminosarum TaxID=384 RepID=A0A154IME9_RHILE|nr:sn-glycerol-3-phosphate ABC transporter ATP-binding protein UgpC [Rhizobium leguminosarum]KZB01759.1 sugar ABC transporter ATP-binding protein [Rhizobium leguminosarum]
MASVNIADVEKHFGAVSVIKGVNIDIADGEFVILVGPSGCGKSTLLRMIAGLEEISGGAVSIDDRIVNDVQPKDRDIAMVFQSYALYPHMTVEENMAFSLRIKGIPDKEIEPRVERAAEILDLSKLLDRLPKQLSGGQRQRVAMGRAIVRDPKVFLFDEPLSNLDAKLRVQMRSEIKALHQRLGTTTIYVTHDQVEAMTMADKIVVMNNGLIEQIGPPLDLYDRPQNIFVASFIGSPAMNLLRGRVDNGSFRLGESTSLPLPHSWSGQSKDIVYGIRPEKLGLGNGGFPALVEVVEPSGAETQVIASAEGEKITAVFRERITVSPGEVINFAVDADDVHLFDATTGQRIGL